MVKEEATPPPIAFARPDEDAVIQRGRTLQADPGAYALGPPPGSVSVDLTGVAATGIAGTLSIGTASGAGTASGVGSSIASAVGGSVERSDTPLALRTEGQPLPREEADPASSTSIANVTEAADSARFEVHVTQPNRTVIIRTVLANQVVVRLTALSLLNALELKIETLRAEGSNSEIAEFHDLKRRVEEFLAANAKRDEAPIADTTLSIADGLRRLLMHENVRDIGLLGVGLSFCAAAGALNVSDSVILAVSAIAGGKKVADVLNAAAHLVWGKGKD